ncbi:MAG: sulfatase-like hydrolase/transferase [Hyphomicrobium sp.]
MTYTDDATRRPVGLAILSTVAFAAITGLLFLIPDLVASRLTDAILPLSKTTPAIILTVAALLMTCAGSRPMRMGLIAFFGFNQIFWLGCLAYFGQIMTPDQFLLAPHEAPDIIGGIVAELPTLLASTALVVASTVPLVLLHWPIRPHGWASPWRHALVTAIAPLAVAGLGIYWFSHHKFSTAYPGPWTPSIIGPYQSSVGALRIAWTSVTAGADLGIRDQVVETLTLPDEPVTVVVIMGESISGRRLGVLGYGKDTTPELSAWATSPPPGFSLDRKLGFSGGVATFASVPSFLRMSYWPMQADRRGLNLFELANRQGFKSWYYSAQAPVFLNLAGGAPKAEAIVTVEQLQRRFGSNNDEGLVKLVSELSDAPQRRFVFLHQRVNHSDYIQHCAHVVPSIDLEPVPVEAPRAVRTPIAYDNGLRCYDRNVAAITRAFLSSKGAVHIFITADHAELMGEKGKWGHSMADLEAATVPYMLLTNRPDSPVAKRFRAIEVPTTYRFAQVVAEALGHSVTTPGISDDTFFLNTTMPFAQAGYMRVDRIEPHVFRVRTYTSNGQMRSDIRHEGPLTTVPAATQ